MEQYRISKSVMETETIQKNGASPKSLMSRINFYFIILMPIILILNACQIISVSGRRTILPNQSSYTSVTYQCSWPVAVQSPVELHYAFGVGSANLDNIGSFLNYNFGGGVDYFFSRNRFQPYLGVGVNNLGYTDKKNEENKLNYNYFNVTPNLGMRFFLSNRFALNASLGYQVGWGKSKFNNEVDTKKMFTGIAPSVGISYVFMITDINK